MIYVKKTDSGYERAVLPKYIVLDDRRMVSCPTPEMEGLLPAIEVIEPVSQYQVLGEDIVTEENGIVTFTRKAEFKDLETLKVEAKTTAVTEQDSTLSQGFECSLGFKVKCTVSDLGKFTSELFGMFITNDVQGYCYDFDGVLHVLSLSEYKILAGELRTYALGVMAKCTAKIEEIKACETPEELISVMEAAQ